MLDTNFVRNNLELVKKKVEAKGVPFADERFGAIDQRRRQLLADSEEMKSRKNKLAKETGYPEKKRRADARAGAAVHRAFQADRRPARRNWQAVEAEFHDFLLNIPNLFHDSVPVGHDASANEMVRELGRKARLRLHPAPALGAGRSRRARSISPAPPRSPARASPSISTTWPSWSGC